jgi:hypothetical protein
MIGDATGNIELGNLWFGMLDTFVVHIITINIVIIVIISTTTDTGVATQCRP